MKKWICIASAVVILAAGWVIADSGRESLRRPPQEINMLQEYSALEDWAFRVRDSGGNVAYEIDDEGNMGTNPGSAEYTPTISVAGASISAANIRDYKVFYIDTNDATSMVCSTGNAGIGPTGGAGVTVTLAVPDATCDKKDFYVINSASGGTDFFVYVPGGTISGGTAISFTANRTVGSANVSSCTDFLTMDGYWDVLHLRARYNSAVSYEVLDYYNR